MPETVTLPQLAEGCEWLTLNIAVNLADPNLEAVCADAAAAAQSAVTERLHD